MNSYRCTRSVPYIGSPAEADASLRQGYYITAVSADAARQAMKRQFPAEPLQSFTVELWQAIESVTVRRYVECPECEGAGEVTVIDNGSPTMSLSYWLSCYPTETLQDCPHCGGSGEVSA